MRQLLILLCLYLPVQGHCQLQAETWRAHSVTLSPPTVAKNATVRYTLKRPILWAGIGAAFASGAAWGIHEKSAHHWNEFSARFPNASPRIWGPDAWRNKYVNGDPAQGRTKWDLGPVQVTKPVHLTDAKHPLATISQAGLFSAGVCVTIGERRPLLHYLADFALIGLARSAGNYLTFNALYH